MSKIENSEKYFQEIKDSLESSLSDLKISEKEGTLLRSLDEATAVLSTVEAIYNKTEDLINFSEHLQNVFEKEFGEYNLVFNKEMIVSTCFINEYIFPQTENYPIEIEGEFSTEILKSFETSFGDWCDLKKEFHEKTQKIIKEEFNINITQKSLDCQCHLCIGDYRAKVRDSVFSEQRKMIDELAEKVSEKIEQNKSINQINEAIAKYRKKMDKTINSLRYHLKRGSLKKLDAQVQDLYKEKFNYSSDLGRVYQEKLKSHFNSLLVDEGHKPELINEQEFKRFFEQLGISIWRNEKYLNKEFSKLLRSITALKRKDISATILQDYLGQFWMHSEARKIKRKIVYHMGPTNSGKTYRSIEALCKAKSGCYLAPLRLLASELFDTMNSKGVKTSLLTGEEVIETDGASHYSSTIEMARLNEKFDCCVIDEIQMISDPQRGWAWTRALVNLNAPEIHLCGDPSALERVQDILKLTGDEIEIKAYERMTELQIMDQTITLSSLQKSDALICFSRRNALKYKSDLEQLGFKVSIVYGRLSPEVRREQARKFDEEETDIMVSTDAIAMGMNLPVKRIVFSTLSKFINSKEFKITPSEIKQIAGRAGRYKRFPTGYVTCLSQVENGLMDVKNALHMDLKQKDRVMVGPDLEIYARVNDALEDNNLTKLSLSEFLLLFNAMTFQKPFYCVDLKEMIDLAEKVEEADEDEVLSSAEIFGFTCAPVNIGLVDHLQYYIWILNHYVRANPIESEGIDATSDNIDYLETAIKCVELYQWLSRHFDGKNFSFDEKDLLFNKSEATERLNNLLSEKTQRHCSSCGKNLPDKHEFNICEICFKDRRNSYKRGASRHSSEKKKDGSSRRTAKGPSRSSRPSKSGGDNKKKKNPKASAFKKFR